MSDNTLFRPKAYPIRKPTDVKLVNGSCHNPPRLSQLGGADKLQETYGMYKNDKTLRKPGGTR